MKKSLIFPTPSTTAFGRIYTHAVSPGPHLEQSVVGAAAGWVLRPPVVALEAVLQRSDRELLRIMNYGLKMIFRFTM